MNRSGGRQPTSVRRVMSARSNSTSTRPVQSRTVITGAMPVVDAESMKYSAFCATATLWSSSSSVSTANPEPSKPARHTERR